MPQLEELQQMLENLELQVQKIKAIMNGAEMNPQFIGGNGIKKVKDAHEETLASGERVIEGVFDGQKMIGPDGSFYSLPANYVSKSKLVEGDMLKLVIDLAGNFIYKQIGPVERDRLVGTLVRDDVTEEFRVLANDRFYKVVLASITYFKGDEGDEVVILTPKGGVSQWAAVEHIIKK